MTTTSALRARRARWLVPAAIVAVVAGGVVLQGAAAGADSGLPPKSAVELATSVMSATPVQFSGTVSESADLGFPALPGASSTSLSLPSLLAGSHVAKVWYASPEQVRLSLVGDLAESDVVRNGRDVWVWSSSDFTVTHTTLPVGQHSSDAVAPVDPVAVAQRVLAAVDPTTSVTVDGTGEVAGRPVYELVVAPRTDASLVGQVRIALDSETSLPLRVEVFARGSSTPAFVTAFTAISLGAPAASVFTFAPPTGATVTESPLPTPGSRPAAGTPGAVPAPAAARRPLVIGSGWTTVVELPDAGALVQGATRPGSGSAGASLSVLLQATVPVQGSFGTARLLQTSLVSVLMLTDGRVFIGAVTPEVLEQAASSAR